MNGLVIAVVAVFSVIFAVNFLAALVVAGWTPDPAISGACTTLIGGAVAYAARSGKNGSGGQ